MDGKTILVDNRLKKYVDSEEESDFSFDISPTTETIEAEKIEPGEFYLPDLSNFTYQDFRDTVNILCDLAFKTFFIGYGILQFFAISSGLLRFLHYDNFFVLLISSMFAFLPIIGSILGAWGACTSWGWNIWNSICIFAVPYVIIHGPLLMITLFESYKDIKRWQRESGKTLIFRENQVFPLSTSER